MENFQFYIYYFDFACYKSQRHLQTILPISQGYNWLECFKQIAESTNRTHYKYKCKMFVMHTIERTMKIAITHLNMLYEYISDCIVSDFMNNNP